MKARGALGPDQGRRAHAWGARSGPRVNTKNNVRTVYPLIVKTPQSAAKYPGKSSYHSPYESQDERRERKERENRARKAKARRRKKDIKLACSTVKPKPRKQPPPPRAGAWNTRMPTGIGKFQLFYDRGDIPVRIGHRAKRVVQWRVNIENLDYNYCLREVREPYSFLAHKGVLDLLANGGEKVLPVVPQLILPLKKALNTRDKSIICKVLKVMQGLVQAGKFIGEALVPYYRQLLPVFNLVLLLQKRTNLGDQIEYGQRNRTNLLDLVTETLELLEEKGGEDAYINIKYMIPTYESCIPR